LPIVAIIPARFGSTRLPGKPLSDIHGKPMIQHVYERVRLARRVDRVLVATDDSRIAAAVVGFGGEAVMTSPAHPSGTDRLAEAVVGTDAEIVVNVQGDEPLLDPRAVDATVEALLADPALDMATLSTPLSDDEELVDPSTVKVVVDGRGNALYFSRSPIPHVRADLAGPGSQPKTIARSLARKHVGLYVYRRAALLRLAGLAPTPLERAEGLEQLRALHHGIVVRVVPIEGWSGAAVDTPEDLERVRALMQAELTKEEGWSPSTSS
jgi:3-deoxy-manno-octulosonate cytidylyltransferase (CMP-KDO synthetase)